MSWLATSGAVILGIATIPQAARLARSRQASDFGWDFSTLNFAGLGLLAVRSWMIEEWAFLAINALTTLFWGFVMLVKLANTLPLGEAPSPPVLRRS